MDHRFSLPVAHALRNALTSGYGRRDFIGDLTAGVTVGIVALPLAMALAIASGVAPQQGLYTAIVAGALIALTGGSHVNVSGPTAAFVVVLLPIAQRFGLGGLLTASAMAGVILLFMGLARLGRFIELVPYPVTVGFTSGIAVVIATLQLKDFLGLPVGTLEGHYWEKLGILLGALPQAHAADLLIGALTLSVMILWPRLRLRFPGHLVALLAGTLLSLLLARIGPEWAVDTIGSRFTWTAGTQVGHGIPPFLPQWQWPWAQPDPDGQALDLSVSLLRDLLGPAFTIAMLGALESLLCAVVADGMAGTRHDPNAELVGQGLGNIVAPFFGGIAATAAIARTATNIRAGARSPLASVIHAGVVLIAVVALADLLAYLPMAALAGLLLMTAWNMSEARHFMHVLRRAPGSDVMVLLTCFSLTVLFDMVVAVTVGMGLAAILFIKRVIDLTEGRLLSANGAAGPTAAELPGVLVYDINGPLFFGAAQKALRTLHTIDPGLRVLILDMTDVQLMDMTGMTALEELVKQAQRQRQTVILCGLAPHLILKLRRVGLRRIKGEVEYVRDIAEARRRAAALIEPPCHVASPTSL
ncbi:MAG TPA: C4-dicarboxylic acid transporter DauA [Candidatus Acidoferrales bacterium]|nr:C4-dicarboxylic acid transporter DauA [Candidatus Acidoferrales bacterium]